MGVIQKSLGQSHDVLFRGETWRLEPLTFLDLADAEALGLIVAGDAKSVSITSVLWLMLRKADPALTDTQRDLCQYTLTPREVRAIFAVTGDGAETATFMGRVIELSGINESDDERSDQEQAGPGEASVSKKARGARRAESATPPAIPAGE